ncbi:ferredoxin [Firmicutes bacterium CAG:552]|jgi:NAD-dependent dihydropyrimidine dehydrogenase PreA subunit|nr:MAG: ferredoxin [Firmicutes bacterium CAG:552_39_19]CDB25528.1 ferredoxin [Firmicutes bacterium CAG:552]
MPRIISEECLSCGSCEGQCPVNAISMGKDHFEVNEAECIDCGACEAACPVSAIKQK